LKQQKEREDETKMESFGTVLYGCEKTEIACIRHSYEVYN